MTAPSQTPEAAGLEVVAWRFRGHADSGWIYTGLGGRHEGCEVEPLVTAASAQAAIDAEKARADRLAKALERIAHEKGVSNVAIARSALQQETQP